MARNSKPAKLKAGEHELSESGTCMRCLRADADLQPPCPGYQTAAEYMAWKAQQPKPKKVRR